jgi:hypothetical protein
MTSPIKLHGVRMRAVGTGESSVVSSDTVLVFEQAANVVSARYRGGSVIDGYLIGRLNGLNLHFRYVQADTDGHLDAGVSEGIVGRTAGGRLRLTEHFQWTTRPQAGVNVFEEFADRSEYAPEQE